MGVGAIKAVESVREGAVGVYSGLRDGVDAAIDGESGKEHFIEGLNAGKEAAVSAGICVAGVAAGAVATAGGVVVAIGGAPVSAARSAPVAAYEGGRRRAFRRERRGCCCARCGAPDSRQHRPDVRELGPAVSE